MYKSCLTKASITVVRTIIRNRWFNCSLSSPSRDYIDLFSMGFQIFLVRLLGLIQLYSRALISPSVATLQGRIVSACNGNRLLDRASFRCVVKRAAGRRDREII